MKDVKKVKHQHEFEILYRSERVYELMFIVLKILKIK